MRREDLADLLAQLPLVLPPPLKSTLAEGGYTGGWGEVLVRLRPEALSVGQYHFGIFPVFFERAGVDEGQRGVVSAERIAIVKGAEYHAESNNHIIERLVGALTARGASRFGAVAIECSHGNGQEGS